MVVPLIQLLTLALHYWAHIDYFRIYNECIEVTEHLGILLYSHHVRANRHFQLVLELLLHHVLLVFVNDILPMLLPDLRQDIQSSGRK